MSRREPFQSKSYSEMTPEEQAAYDQRQGIPPGRREEVAASLARIDLQNLRTRVQSASFGERHFAPFAREGETAADVMRTAEAEIAAAEQRLRDAEARAAAAKTRVALLPHGELPE